MTHYTIITPPGIEQPYNRFARIIPAHPKEYNQALDQARGTVILTTRSLESGWIQNLHDTAFGQDAPATLPIVLHNLPVRFDPRWPSPLDLSLQLWAAGHLAQPTGLIHYDYVPTLRELRYLHHKWMCVFPQNLNQSWGWGTEGIYWNNAIIHHASTTLDHQVGSC